MRIFNNYNVTRRSALYWISLLLLFASAENIVMLLNDGIIKILADNIDKVLKIFLPYTEGPIIVYRMMIVYAILVFASVTLVFVINIFIAAINNSPKAKEKKVLFQFLKRNEFICDVLMGGLIIYIALYGLWKLYINDLNISGQFVIYSLCIVIGNILYWGSVVPYKRYIDIKKKMENKMDLFNIWYLVSNSTTELSIFSQLPVNNKSYVPIIDKADIVSINRNNNNKLEISDFSKCVFLLDGDGEIGENYLDEVKDVLHIAHIRVVLFYVKGKSNEDQVHKIIGELKNIRDFDLIELPKLELERIINIFSRLRVYDFLSVQYKGNPLENICDNKLMEAYKSLYKGPKICFDFMTICINNLEVMPAIYALFDYIDLQYRMVLSFIFEPEAEWFSKMSKRIGNINEMATIIEENSTFFNTDFYMEQVNIFPSRDINLIHRYLPNYKVVERYGYIDIVYLSKSLRNVLRGHGFFDIVDATELYNIVLKLALMTNCILRMNDMSVNTTGEAFFGDNYFEVYGKYGEIERVLSPFLLAKDDSNILVFNNMKKGIYEYIDYLDGTVILPSFIGISTI